MTTSNKIQQLIGQGHTIRCAQVMISDSEECTCKLIKDPCEYNPNEHRACYENEVHAPAEWIVGANGKWRLCSKCAALPEFKRFRVRRKIQTANGGREESNGK